MIAFGAIFALWLVLAAYWVHAVWAMPAIAGKWKWWREIALRLGFFALVLLLLRLAIYRQVLPQAPAYAFNTDRVCGLVGTLLCALGIALAILGRAWLGRSGGTLVTTGPYAWLRHPIYAGMLLAVLGSAIAQSALWLLPLMAYGPALICSARREERRLSERFPERYPAYMKRTGMLLPFVL